MAELSVPTIESFTVTLIVRRFDPENDTEPKWEDFDVEMYGTDRVLDALHKIKWEQDGSLTFRRSCAHGVCGSDAMRINGRNRLACKTLIKDLDISKPIYVEPIKGLPVEKDLIVDMTPFYKAYLEINHSWSPPISLRKSASSLQKIVRATTTQPSAFFVPLAQAAVLCSGPMVSTSAQLQS